MTSARLDAGAKALREFEMSDRISVDWELLPKTQKRKWWAKAQVVLEAADAAPESPQGSEEAND